MRKGTRPTRPIQAMIILTLGGSGCAGETPGARENREEEDAALPGVDGAVTSQGAPDAAAYAVDASAPNLTGPSDATARDAAQDRFIADSTMISRDSGPAMDGSARPSNPELDWRCTVPVTYRNQAAGSPGGMIFDREIPDVVATMQAHARAVCNVLYRKAEEVKNVTAQSLTIDMHDGVAYASRGGITFSAVYIGNYANNRQPAAINFELNGVLVHESTHVWQYNNGGGWLVEAMADYVRYKVGFDRLARRRPGGNWNSPYTTGGFFIHWIEEKYDRDFGYKVNMGMKDPGFSYPALVQEVTGKNVEAVWAEYQAAIRMN